MADTTEQREIDEYKAYKERQARYKREIKEGDVTIEQMVRNILETAVEDGIVTFNSGDYDSTPTVQHLTSGDITGPANVLALYFASRKRRSVDG